MLIIILSLLQVIFIFLKIVDFDIFKDINWLFIFLPTFFVWLIVLFYTVRGVVGIFCKE